jgi:2,3-bisphosphoglycerate-independent phosphoglycerate mutase
MDMDPMRIPDDLVLRDPDGGSILLVVLDGLGGLPHSDSGQTELEAAQTPNLDALAARSSLGMLLPVAPGVTPGSGPAHLALFGYDPLQNIVGRGVLSALGVGFELMPGDVAIRLNLATLDGDRRILDRRAGRPSDEEGRRIVEKIKSEVKLENGTEFFLSHEKEHRAVLILRGKGLGGDISDTDPQEVGVPPLDPTPLESGSAKGAAVLKEFIARVDVALTGEERINGVLARGIASFAGFPSIDERFGLEGIAVAKYPMYRGVARLVGMRVPGGPPSDEEAVALLEKNFLRSGYNFLHFKAPDSRGEDGDFEAKALAIEAVDAFFPRLLALQPDVLLVTGDHSTPSAMSAHSWHHVPLLIASRYARPTGATFSETECRRGDVGVLESKHLMGLALAHAGRMAKFGA